jgi:TRAP-type mannitol/chloroaromatic compound transport system permease large subunit
MNMEMAYLTPPFGFNLFFMRRVAPESITMDNIYRAVWPFLGLQGIGPAAVILRPELGTRLPPRMIR